MFLHETAKPRQIGGHAGDAHDGTLSWTHYITEDESHIIQYMV